MEGWGRTEEGTVGVKPTEVSIGQVPGWPVGCVSEMAAGRPFERAANWTASQSLPIV